jgi:hypothetical protein
MVPNVTLHVTRVVLSRAEENTRQSVISSLGREVFRVSWTLAEVGEPEREFTQSHYSLSAAHAHTIKLLSRIPDGAPISDVYIEDLDAVVPVQPRTAERCVCGHPTHTQGFCSCGCSISESDTGRDASTPSTSFASASDS